MFKKYVRKSKTWKVFCQYSAEKIIGFFFKIFFGRSSRLKKRPLSKTPRLPLRTSASTDFG
ncbi:MAG: hypothetical protein CRN43_10490 [Candidatus Nephrothrix sp. EaCA]|nr:MAG: hypothetical protein CRN43_10490 [Candidatus Nephrothrix sp. EaCA]